MLNFTGKYVGSSTPVSPTGESKVIKIDFKSAKRVKPGVQLAIPPPPPPSEPLEPASPEVIASWLTASMREKRWPNLGALIQELVEIRVRNKLIMGSEAADLIGALKALLESSAFKLHDPSADVIRAVRQELAETSDSDMLHSLECAEREAFSRTEYYKKEFYRPIRQALGLKTTNPEKYKDSTAWSHCSLLLITVYRCVEDQLPAGRVIRQASPKS
ncbi:MAG: hypothetical protein WC813_03330 [Patescibacteria group bacterium]